MEGERGKEEGRKRGREGGKEGGREGRREGGKEGGREGGERLQLLLGDCYSTIITATIYFLYPFLCY